MMKMWLALGILTLSGWGFVSWWGMVVGLMAMTMVYMVGGFSFILMKLNSGLMGDLWGFGLVILSLVLGILMVMSSLSLARMSGSEFSLLVMGLLLVLFLSFSEMSLMGFYFYFEASLVPTLLIILGFGYQPERLQAGLYFMFYTIFASLPLLFLILAIYSGSGGLLMVPWVEEFASYEMYLGGMVVVSAFLVKMPMFLVHLWLPKAHVEAPVAGSMVLAGVLLKLGGYGLGRVGVVLSGVLTSVGVYLVGLSLVGMLIVGFICCQMNDLKALVAYSSVAHMGLVLGGLMSGFKWGMLGSLGMMLSHGLSSSGLFYMANVYYERSASRSMFINKGLLVYLPGAGLFLFLLCAANISAPVSLNLLSEIFLMGSVLKYDWGMLLIFPVGSFMGAVFTIYLFSRTQHGKYMNSGQSFWGIRNLESVVMLMHLIPLNLLFLKPEVIMGV
uniref:NADH-ubiquinone oxidoreductase chain 4 n=1 Tax=Megalothorax incertus TaxID=2579793 RepID=A0A8E8L901_9HEXA|nr:NADH dehydrogenase subunit 4 [Megalothorax incertus]